MKSILAHQEEARIVFSRSLSDTMFYRKIIPHKALKISYEFQYGDAQDAQVFSVSALNLRDAIGLFNRSHPNTDIHEILVMGRHGRWVPVSPDVLEVA